MKKIRLLLLSAALLFSFACTRDGSGVSPDKGNPDGHKVSVEAALADLHSVLGQIDGQTRGGSTRSVASVSAVKAADMLSATRSGELPDVEDLVYIANFENGEGYAILGADDRLESVIAVTEQGSLTPEELAAAANGGDGDLSESPVIPEIINYITGGWTGGIDGPPILPPMYYTDYGPWSDVFISYTPSLLPMKWGQEEPYNYYVKQYENSTYVGCNPVALGQIIATMSYYGDVRGITYIGGRSIDTRNLWESVGKNIDNKSNDKDQYNDPKFIDSDRAKAVANFLYGVALAINTTFTPSGSSANRHDTRDLMIDMGFKNVSLSGYDENLIFSRVADSRLPVWIEGQSDAGGYHAWVIDGVVKQFRSVNKRLLSGELVESKTEYRNLFHCNFGYVGEGDGYYISKIFKIKEGPVFKDENLGDRSNAGYGDLYNFTKDYYIITFTGI